jgi:uncharacterized membrane protein YuzA (DUF378 family)
MSATRTRTRSTGAPSRGREVVAVVLAAIAALVTGVFGWALIGSLTTEHVGDEGLVAAVITAAIGVVAVYLWVGAVSLHKSSRREVDPEARRLALGGLLAIPVLVVVGSILVGPISIVAYVLAGLAAVVALVGAIRE